VTSSASRAASSAWWSQSPFAGSTVLYDVLVNGTKVTHPMDTLRKRIK